jgi:hypothetical protein
MKDRLRVFGFLRQTRIHAAVEKEKSRHAWASEQKAVICSKPSAAQDAAVIALTFFGAKSGAGCVARLGKSGAQRRRN